jgi:hypothetical protein
MVENNEIIWRSRTEELPLCSLVLPLLADVRADANQATNTTTLRACHDQLVVRDELGCKRTWPLNKIVTVIPATAPVWPTPSELVLLVFMLVIEPLAEPSVEPLILELPLAEPRETQCARSTRNGTSNVSTCARWERPQKVARGQ